MAIRATTPMMASTQKIPRQDQYSSSCPPSNGPSSGATAIIRIRVDSICAARSLA
ncbi:hypothetical protein D3C73_1358510 [compost metagenome]